MSNRQARRATQRQRLTHRAQIYGTIEEADGDLLDRSRLNAIRYTVDLAKYRDHVPVTDRGSWAEAETPVYTEAQKSHENEQLDRIAAAQLAARAILEVEQ